MNNYQLNPVFFNKNHFTYENYVIDIIQNKSTYDIEFFIENIKNNSCYQLTITKEDHIKYVSSIRSNVSDIKALYTFFVKSFSHEENYEVSIYQTPIYSGNVKEHNELILKFSATLDKYYEIYANYQICEKILTMEEKLIKMMDKMKNQYEEKIELLEKEVQKLQNIFIHEKYEHIKKSSSCGNEDELLPVTKNIVESCIRNHGTLAHRSELQESKKINESEKVNEPVVQNIKIRKEKKIVNIIVENQNEIHDENDPLFFYISDLEETSKKNVEEKNDNKKEEQKNDDNNIIKPVYLKKNFVYKYDSIIQNSRYAYFYNQYIQNCDEEIIYYYEKDHLKVYITNGGKIFVFHNYAGLSSVDELQNYTTIFMNQPILKYIQEYIESNFIYNDKLTQKSEIISYYKQVDLFINELRNKYGVNH
jgi:hypothetical protein